MRTDETGKECPETLGEYRDLCAAIGGEDCEAVAFLDKKIGDPINKKGRDSKVIVSDYQMRTLLMSRLAKKVEKTDD